MSVPTSKRKTAKAQFVQDIRDTRHLILELTRKFPKGWYRSIISNLEQLAAQAYSDVIAGNSIYLGDTTKYEDVLLRHKYFARCAATLSSLDAELTFCLSCVDRGNNFFGKKKDYLSAFSRCTDMCLRGRNNLRKVMASDNKRWDRILAKRESCS